MPHAPVTEGGCVRVVNQRRRSHEFDPKLDLGDHGLGCLDRASPNRQRLRLTTAQRAGQGARAVRRFVITLVRTARYSGCGPPPRRSREFPPRNIDIVRSSVSPFVFAGAEKDGVGGVCGPL